jgi:hypothetical protein
MIQRTVIDNRTMPAARSVPHTPGNAYPLTFLALAFGLVAGVALTGIVIPVVVHTVVPAVVRIVTGA